MLTSLSIFSLNQGNLNAARRSIGQFDAHLLDDIGYGSASALPQTSRRAGIFARWFRPANIGRSK